MNRMIRDYIDGHSRAVATLSGLAADIARAGDLLVGALRGGGKVLVMGNGGSAADAQHLAAELVGRFETDRRGWPAIALTTDSSIVTAVGNDFGFEQVFARQVEALAHEKDVVVGISTSGNSQNVINAVRAASGRGCTTIGLLGRDGGELEELVDLALTVPVAETPHIQEVHAIIVHLLCRIVDTAMAD